MQRRAMHFIARRCISLHVVAFHCMSLLFIACRRCGRVAPVGCPTGALTGPGLGDFHHPALPWRRPAARPLPPVVTGTGRPRSRPGSCGPPDDRRHTGRLCSAPSAAAPRYPTSSLLCSPPTPLRPRRRLWFPLPPAYHQPPYALLCRPGVRTETPGASDACGAGRPRPRPWGGPSGVSQVPGPSVPTCRGLLPRLGRYPLARCGDIPFRLQRRGPPGLPGIDCVSGLISHGPHACLPTHQPACYHPDGKTGYRPAGLRFDRAGLAPAGRQTEFPKSLHDSLLSDQHSLVASNDETSSGLRPSGHIARFLEQARDVPGPGYVPGLPAQQRQV
jgi:hypothetical protein